MPNSYQDMLPLVAQIVKTLHEGKKFYLCDEDRLGVCYDTKAIKLVAKHLFAVYEDKEHR